MSEGPGGKKEEPKQDPLEFLDIELPDDLIDHELRIHGVIIAKGLAGVDVAQQERDRLDREARELEVTKADLDTRIAHWRDVKGRLQNDERALEEKRARLQRELDALRSARPAPAAPPAGGAGPAPRGPATPPPPPRGATAPRPAATPPPPTPARGPAPRPADPALERSKKIDDFLAEYFFYKDTVPEGVDRARQEARNVDGRFKENYLAYAMVLHKMLKGTDAPKLESLKQTIRTYYQQAIQQLNFPTTKYSASQSWIYWDIAKQRFLFQNPAKSDPKYPLADPLEFDRSPQSKEVVQQIADRHIGGEFQQYALQTIRDSSADDININKDDPTYDNIMLLVKDGTLHSYQLVILGRLVRQHKSVADLTPAPAPSPRPPSPTVDDLRNARGGTPPGRYGGANPPAPVADPPHPDPLPDGARGHLGSPEPTLITSEHAQRIEKRLREWLSKTGPSITNKPENIVMGPHYQEQTGIRIPVVIDGARYEIDPAGTNAKVVEVNYGPLTPPQPLTKDWLTKNHPEYKQEAEKLKSIQQEWWDNKVRQFSLTPPIHDPLTYISERKSPTEQTIEAQFWMGGININVVFQFDPTARVETIQKVGFGGALKPCNPPQPLTTENIQQLYDGFIKTPPSEIPPQPEPTENLLKQKVRERLLAEINYAGGANLAELGRVFGMDWNELNDAPPEQRVELLIKNIKLDQLAEILEVTVDPPAPEPEPPPTPPLHKGEEPNTSPPAPPEEPPLPPEDPRRELAAEAFRVFLENLHIDPAPTFLGLVFIDKENIVKASFHISSPTQPEERVFFDVRFPLDHPDQSMVREISPVDGWVQRGPKVEGPMTKEHIETLYKKYSNKNWEQEEQKAQIDKERNELIAVFATKLGLDKQLITDFYQKDVLNTPKPETATLKDIWRFTYDGIEYGLSEDGTSIVRARGILFPDGEAIPVPVPPDFATRHTLYKQERTAVEKVNNEFGAYLTSLHITPPPTFKPSLEQDITPKERGGAVIVTNFTIEIFTGFTVEIPVDDFTNTVITTVHGSNTTTKKNRIPLIKETVERLFAEVNKT